MDINQATIEWLRDELTNSLNELHDMRINDTANIFRIASIEGRVSAMKSSMDRELKDVPELVYPF